jgi:hypothetical protein
MFGLEDELQNEIDELKELLKVAVGYIETNDDGFETIDGEGWYLKCRCCGAGSTMSRDSDNVHNSGCELNETLQKNIEIKKRIYGHLGIDCDWR